MKSHSSVDDGPWMTEYEQAWEGFRHVHATIWQAFYSLGAVTVALFGLAAFSEGDLVSWFLAFGPVPLLFWCLFVFAPMNHYGDKRVGRARDIEEALTSQQKPSLKLAHEFLDRRSSTGPSAVERTFVMWLGELPRRIWRAFWPFPPSVRFGVGLLTGALLALEGFIIYQIFHGNVSTLTGGAA